MNHRMSVEKKTYAIYTTLLLLCGVLLSVFVCGQCLTFYFKSGEMVNLLKE